MGPQPRTTVREFRKNLATAIGSGKVIAVGTPDEIVQRLLAYRAAGIDLAWVFLLFPDLPATRSLILFAREVLPAYRAQTPSPSGRGRG